MNAADRKEKKGVYLCRIKILFETIVIAKKLNKKVYGSPPSVCVSSNGNN